MSSTHNDGSTLPEYSLLPFIDPKSGTCYHIRIRRVNNDSDDKLQLAVDAQDMLILETLCEQNICQRVAFDDYKRRILEPYLLNPVNLNIAPKRIHLKETESNRFKEQYTLNAIKGLRMHSITQLLVDSFRVSTFVIDWQKDNIIMDLFEIQQNDDKQMTLSKSVQPFIISGGDRLRAKAPLLRETPNSNLSLQ